MTFEKCLMECAANQELIKQFDRLRGTNLQMKGAPVELMVDEASGRLADDVGKFVSFVFECIYLPVMAKADENLTKV